MQMTYLQFINREQGATGSSDSDKSTFAATLGVRARKNRAVYEKSPIKLEKLLGKDFNRWELWVMYYKTVEKKNDWIHEQATVGFCACSTYWAVEGFETVPCRYIEQVTGDWASTFETLLENPKTKIQKYRSPRATLSEFMSVRKNDFF